MVRVLFWKSFNNGQVCFQVLLHNLGRLHYDNFGISFQYSFCLMHYHGSRFSSYASFSDASVASDPAESSQLSMYGCDRDLFDLEQFESGPFYVLRLLFEFQDCCQS